MAVSSDVTLPRYHKARFPNRCVVCDCHSPESHIRLITGTLGSWTWLISWFGNPFVVKAPACAGCAWRLHAWRFLSLAFTVSVGLIAILVIWPHFQDWVPRGLRYWARMAVGLVCLLPQVAFEVYFARPFDVTAYEDKVEYEFTSREYAVDFALANFEAAWVKINGNSLK